MTEEERDLLKRGIKFGLLFAILLWMALWGLFSCSAAPKTTNPVVDAPNVSMADALRPSLLDSAVAMLTKSPAKRSRVHELFGETACQGFKGVNPYILCDPYPTVGGEWRCTFLTSVCPTPPEPDWPMWIIVGQRLPAPIDFTPYGMPGCWLHVKLKDVVFVPSGSRNDGTLTRSLGRVTLRWIPPPSMAGKSICFQLLTRAPNGFLSSHAVEVTIGS